MHKIQRVQQLPREIPDAVVREGGVVVLLHEVVEGAAEALEDEAVEEQGAEDGGFDERRFVEAFDAANYFDGDLGVLGAVG